MGKSKRNADGREPEGKPEQPAQGGPRVYKHGGLVFVFVIFGLMTAIILAEALGD